MGALCSLPQDMYTLHYISIFCQGLVGLNSAAQAMKEGTRSSQEEMWELLRVPRRHGGVMSFRKGF